MTSPEELLEFLAKHEIATRTYEHVPVFTVEESRRFRGDLPGGHCKSLFLKDRKDGLWLVVTLEHRRVDLKRLGRQLGARKGLSFASAERLMEVLGVRPGAVTPFAVINDRGSRVNVVLDRGMLELDPLNYHPLTNDRTTAISPTDLSRFLVACRHMPTLIDL